MSIFVFYESLKKGISGVYFLYSKDQFMLQEALDSFLKEVSKKTGGESNSCGEFACQHFDINEKPSLSVIIEAIKTPGFFGSTIWTVINGAELLKIKDFKAFAEEIAGTGTGATNILFLYNGSLPKELTEVFKDARFISVELPERELSRWIKYKARELGLELSDEVIEYILELTEGEAGIISSELKKLELAGIKKPSIEDVKELLQPHTEYDIKDLFDALKRGDKLKILRIFRSMEDELPQAIGALNKFYASTKEYHRALPLLHEIDLRARVQKEYIEPLLLKLLHELPHHRVR